MTTAAKAPSRRNRQLARIHCLKKELDIDDVTYRNLVWAIGRKRSAGELDDHGRLQLIQQLSGQQYRGRRKPTYPGRPHNTDISPQRKKIEALLADAKRPWSYAEAVCKKVTDKDRIAFCDPADLHKVIAALAIDAKRHTRTASHTGESA